MRELRAPLVAIAVLCLMFQVIPFAASAAPGLPVFGSICYGAPDNGSDQPGSTPVHPAFCVCGQVCPHTGLVKSSPLVSVYAAKPQNGNVGIGPGSLSGRIIDRAGFTRPVGRAPPFVS